MTILAVMLLSCQAAETEYVTGDIDKLIDRQRDVLPQRARQGDSAAADRLYIDYVSLGQFRDAEKVILYVSGKNSCYSVVILIDLRDTYGLHLSERAAALVDETKGCK